MVPNASNRLVVGQNTSVPSPKSLEFCCVQNGSSARREEGAYLDRYVTDEQRSSRPIFNATLRAAASWLFFCVARSTVMIQIAALRSRLEKQPTDLRRSSRDLGDGTLAPSQPQQKERRTRSHAHYRWVEICSDQACRPVFSRSRISVSSFSSADGPDAGATMGFLKRFTCLMTMNRQKAIM